jgi:exosortase E/protease (VPEID-CTERM system)
MSAVVARRGLHPLQPRLALLGVLLLAEGAFLAGRFDAQPLLRGTEAWWAQMLARLGFAMPLLTAVATAIVLFGGARLWKVLEASAASAPRGRSWPFMVAHAVAFVAFFWLTAVVFEDIREGIASPWWALPWGAVGIATVVAAAAAMLPRQVLAAFVRQGGVIVLACAAVGAAAWAAGQVTFRWWEPLGQGTLAVVGWVLRLFATDPIVAPEFFIVGTQTFQVEIADRCSGYEGIGLIWVFLGVYLWVFRGSLRFPRAFLLLPLGTVIIWVANALRIAALLGVGTLLSPEIAVGGFHANSGSLLLCCVALGMGWAARRSAFFTQAEAPSAVDDTRNPTAAYVLPLLAIVATSMATGSFTEGGFDPFYGLRVVAAAAVLWAYRRDYGDWRWTWSWFPIAMGVAVLVLWLALERVPVGQTSHPIATALAALPPGAAAAWLVCRILGTAVTVPIAEELAFRGYLLRRLVNRDFEQVPAAKFSWLPFVVSSVLFGLMHDRLLAGTLAGMCYAAVVYRRGSLADAVVAHATTNALLAAYVLATGSWWLW